MKKLSAEVCAVTHPGRVRKENEDNYSLNGRITGVELKKGSAYVQKMSEPFHLAVCDGMGGESYGDVASKIAVEVIAKSAPNIYESGDDFSYAISSSLDDANTKICNEIATRGKRMGTTLAAIYVVKGRVICVGMGDTRIYHFSKGLLEQKSFDHTHAQGFVDAGEVSPEDSSSIPDAKRLTKHLGVFPDEAPLSPVISAVDDVENGDIIMLCSDGLTDMLSDAEISAILTNADSAQDATGKLVRKALEKGGRDNITVVTAFMQAEKSAIFVPIAKAMVGDKDTDYSEEYRNSYGPNIPEDDESVASPYANADASAADRRPIDKKQIAILAAVALFLVVAVVVALFVVKAVRDRYMKRDETSTTSLSDYYSSITSTEIDTWTITEPTTESTTESTSEEETTTTTTTTTRRYSTTTRRYTTTRRPTTTTTTTRKPTTTTTTTKPTTESTTESSGTSETSSTSPTSSTSETSSTSQTSSTSETSSTSQTSSTSETSSTSQTSSTSESSSANP